MNIIRYNTEELESFLNDIESDCSERKESFDDSAPQKCRETVCAFANDFPNHQKPGVIFIGAKDNGEPSGVPITDRMLQQLSDMESDGNILSPPVLTVEKVKLKGFDMAVITVLPSDTPPVRYKGRVYIRRGSRNAIATAQEEIILSEKRRSKDLPYDIHAVSSAKLEDLSRLLFENEYLPNAFASDILESNHRSYEQKLSSCKLVTQPDNPIPTVLGILTLGKSPQDFIPCSYVQFLRINGTELADELLDQVEFGGRLPDLIRTTLEKIYSYIRTPMDVTSRSTHSTQPDYPRVALEQIFYNAILHRVYNGTNAPVRIYWFNDRIEIYSPGGPFGCVNTENFGKPGITDYRNPDIADIMKVFGFVQKFGRGIALCRSEMNKNGNPEPEFKVTENTVLCILRKRVSNNE